MSECRIVRLGDVCKQDRTTVKTGRRTDLRYIGLETIMANTGQFNEGELSKTPETPQANSFRFGAEHVLYGKLRPYLNKVALADFEGKCSTEIIPLLPSPELDRRYLSYFLRSPLTVTRISEKTAGARMPRADMDYIFGLEMNLPNLSKQHHIVDIFSRAEGIVRLRREAEIKTAELIPALFLDMFGDPATNPKGWPVLPLNEVSEVISGATKGRRLAPEDVIELPYMRVANVKDGHLDLTEIKTIEIKRTEIERLKLEPGDLLMTEGGDPDKLGRAALWQGQIELCVHQNHIFKVRSNRKFVLPEYLRALAGSRYGKNHFLRIAKKTTGIASINKTQLSAFPVVLPSMITQEKFVKQVALIESIQALQSAAAVKAQAAFEALLSHAFLSAPTNNLTDNT